VVCFAETNDPYYGDTDNIRIRKVNLKVIVEERAIETDPSSSLAKVALGAFERIDLAETLTAMSTGSLFVHKIFSRPITTQFNAIDKSWVREGSFDIQCVELT
jgi:hypothetical protein